ncbi:MAG: hypothetical protein OI74_10445 [Gammaproteobacteria bacterium (ex Lamellibrachia satsuma)]|nr:MAG: hypothetical protein OI74_10445 [Gammaproteobacteria bacterium (ex Lamellibrachia satsuma)]RRS37338.1 MAG: hypothetical protein NV67_01570 [Gammaproteobacteria bacterium (ex Lamellibrachia satsuma)]
MKLGDAQQILAAYQCWIVFQQEEMGTALVYMYGDDSISLPKGRLQLVEPSFIKIFVDVNSDVRQIDVHDVISSKCVPILTLNGRIMEQVAAQQCCLPIRIAENLE